MRPGKRAISRSDAGSAASRLFRKYVLLLLGVVAVVLVPSGLLDLWFSYREVRTLLVRIQDEQATAAAGKISHFLKEVEGQLAWAVQLPIADRTDDEWRFDAFRIFRQAPAVTEIAQLEAGGRELYRMSRQAMDVIGGGADHSKDPLFIEAVANKIQYGPVYFLNESEPYLTMAIAGARADYGVAVAQVNLKFIWEVVSRIRVGQYGRAYVVDRTGRLIAHPDISLVLSNTDMSAVPQVQAALSGSSPDARDHEAVDLRSHPVLSAHAFVEPPGWLVFAELPAGEAYGPLHGALIRSGLLLLAGLVFAVLAGLFLARRMMLPIRKLGEGAARIGAGDMTQKIEIRTGDELEALGNEFNRMAARLQESYATLERKVEERTRELEIANQAKSRFLAVASHDLRQPLHALGLFVAQLRGRSNADERKEIIGRISAAVAAMNELFNALLDISKLDAGILKPKPDEFQVSRLLKQMETTFAGAAREKGVDFRTVDCSLWVRSDFLLLSRIVSNLVSNAVRYTSSGRILVGCRRQGGELRIEVWDTGPGIPEDQHRHIFGEFFRLNTAVAGGLGLGLAIVERLSRLLGHPVDVRSLPGKGSSFSVTLPYQSPTASATATPRSVRGRSDGAAGKLIVVIDDDPLVLQGMRGLLQGWGCRVASGPGDRAALAAVAGEGLGVPDLIISDYRLRDGRTGCDAIAELRRVFSSEIPAFLVSGDTEEDLVREAGVSGFVLLHKPVNPMALRVAMSRALRHEELRVATHKKHLMADNH